MTTHATTDTTTTPPASGAPVPLDVYEELTRLEAARVQQLRALDDTALDAVGVAYRDSILRILEEIRTSRRRLMAGLHGVCTGCGGEVTAERLELRPWATSCTDCARRERS
ncbi:TraR/DksA C4-type zinc finger protein [Nocardioides caldifontis]|uniref:TraR/DksA C4-type zinc finger protein n=1 Tax=Nocardioides caldifontis TaxID=2588938 RepID=UPI0011DF1863|nr:TraR/DksA C4-type zinc finger protein [Nocardioides caldifontis]